MRSVTIIGQTSRARWMGGLPFEVGKWVRKRRGKGKGREQV
jgi:hypothetical protein